MTVTCELSDLINDTRRHLYANQTPQLNLLADPIGAFDTSMNLQYPPGALGQRGAICSIELEHIRVWETNGNTCIIERGVDGTDAASHALGASPLGLVEVMPKFSPFMCMRAINDDLQDLSSPDAGLFQMLDLELTYNPSVSGYDMTDVNTSISVNPADVIAIQEIRFKIPGPTKHLPAIRKFDVVRNIPIADYPSGMALMLYENAFPGMPIHVRYRARFNEFTSLSDDAQAVAGLPFEANGLPPLGAACALMAGREVKRNFTEATSDPLQLDLVTGGQVLNSYKGLMLLRQERIMRVAAGLLKQYGPPLRVF